MPEETHAPSWLEVHCTCHAEAIDIIEALHLKLGALAITLRDPADDPIFEPEVGQTPVWETTQITALYSSEQAPEDIIDHLIKQTNVEQLHNIRTQAFKDQPWEREWLKYFKPLLISNRLMVTPSHLYDDTQRKTLKQRQQIPLILDPGLAFGTGTHPTTHLCLEWLCSTLENISPNASLLDYGCGSGILSIAAALLGVPAVTAIDIDPQALIATQQNATTNQVNAQISASLPTPINTTFDFIVANILAGPLISLAETLTEYLASTGKIALSGILCSQTSSVIAAFSSFCKLEIIATREDWALLAGHRL